MTVYFQGSEVACFPTRVGSYSVAAATATYANTSNVRMTFQLAAAADFTNYFESSTFEATECWTHAVVYMTSSSGSPQPYMKWRDQGGTDRFRLRWVSADTHYFDYWNGSSWVNILNAITLTRAVKVALDVYIKIGAAGVGRVSVYVNGVSQGGDMTVDYTVGGAVSSISKLRISGCSSGISSYFCRWSEIIVADWNTIGSKLVVRAPDANGNYTAWAGTGGYADIDEYTADGVLLTSDTADQRASFSLTAFPTEASGESIEAVRQLAWAVKDAAGPQNVNMFSRISGTDYDGADIALPATLDTVDQTDDVSPATLGVWTAAELNAAEFGFRSRT